MSKSNPVEGQAIVELKIAESGAEAPRRDTRTRLLRGAEWLIVHEGVHALTIRRIAAEAQANSALIRYHFGSVGGLLFELARCNSEPILQEQKLSLERALASGPSLDGLLDALLRPLWWSAAYNPGERALVVVDEIASRADAQLRQQVWSWFAEATLAFRDALEPLLPQLDVGELSRRLRFLGAAALDMPPRGARSPLSPHDAPLSEAEEQERFRQFLAFARGALTAPAA